MGLVAPSDAAGGGGGGGGSRRDGRDVGDDLDEYEAELEAHRASTPKARAEREAKGGRARRERSRRNADGSISWNAPPAPSAPPRRASGIANNDAVRAASTEDASVSWGRSHVRSQAEARRIRTRTRVDVRVRTVPDESVEGVRRRGGTRGEKPRVNPDGSVPWDAYDPEDAWKPSDEDRAAYEDALERADETDEDAPVEEEEEEEEEETSYTIGEGEGGAVAWNAAPEEETVSASAEENSVPAKLAMTTRDYDGVEAVDDGFIRDPEEAAEYEARLFTAALGDSLVEPDSRRARKRRESSHRACSARSAVPPGTSPCARSTRVMPRRARRGTSRSSRAGTRRLALDLWTPSPRRSRARGKVEGHPRGGTTQTATRRGSRSITTA